MKAMKVLPAGALASWCTVGIQKQHCLGGKIQLSILVNPVDDVFFFRESVALSLPVSFKSLSCF